MSKHGHYWLLFVGNNCSCNLVLKMNSGEIILRQHVIEAQCHFCICDIGPFTLGMKAQLLYSDFLMRDGEKTSLSGDGKRNVKLKVHLIIWKSFTLWLL